MRVDRGLDGRAPRLRSTRILFVGNLLEPGGCGIDVHRQMDHPSVNRSAVPMSFSGFNPYRASSCDFLNKLTFLLETARSLDYKEQL